MKLLLISVLFIGLVSANTKEDLISRLITAQHQLEAASNDFSTHGFDYFAEIVNSTLARVNFAHSEVDKLSDNASPTDAAFWINELKEIEKILPGVIRFPAIREIYKSGALYLAVMKTNNHDDSLPAPDALHGMVHKIMAQEDYIKTFKHFPADSTARDKEEHNLNTMYDTLVNVIKNAHIPNPEDFAALEIEAKKKISKFLVEGKKEEAHFFQEALDKFLFATYHAAQIYPLDSFTRYNQFMKAASGHYEDYRILSAMVFFESIDCSGNKCKKN